MENYAAHGSTSSEPSKSNPTIQFLVRLFSEMKTLIIRFDTIESWNSIERAAVNLYEQAALPGANSRGIRPLVKARQLADEIFSLIWRLSKRNSGKESWDSEAKET